VLGCCHDERVNDDEWVAVVDESGAVVGSAPRSRVRAENLWHAATGVLVRNSFGDIYVHRRTDTKDLFPGAHDCLAGGVLLAGETPEAGALRELEEELGISGVPIRPVTRGRYADDQTRYIASVYEITWDGPIVHQADEVAWGAWMAPERLHEKLADPGWPFVPDSRFLMEEMLDKIVRDRVLIDSGWDSRAWVVEGTWIDREPRRPEVAERLQAETRLLPWLAPLLPVPLPLPRVVATEPLRIRHRLISGAPISEAEDGAQGELGDQVAAALLALHSAPVGEAVTRGVPDGPVSHRALQDVLARCRRDVLPLLAFGEREAGEALLDELGAAPFFALVHGDLGPEHLLVRDDAVSGIIDWTDAHVGDPALDLSWGLHSSAEAFASELLRVYAPDDDTRRRADLWHRLGPWHEVIYGLDEQRPDLVVSGLDGVRARLAAD
jgi:aminoglycoside phosphotransferase (APT) family kinase protein/isopentenyldiphosphate isomerase